MGKKDLKKLTKGQLIKLLLKVSNHEDLPDNDPFKDEVAQEPTKRIKPTPPLRTGSGKVQNPNLFHARVLMKMGTSLFQNQGLTDHLKCKMYEDHRN